MTAAEQPNLVLDLDSKPYSRGQPNAELRFGSICPGCSKGTLYYNGLLELECPVCGYTFGSGGCT